MSFLLIRGVQTVWSNNRYLNYGDKKSKNKASSRTSLQQFGKLKGKSKWRTDRSDITHFEVLKIKNITNPNSQSIFPLCPSRAFRRLLRIKTPQRPEPEGGRRARFQPARQTEPRALRQSAPRATRRAHTRA